MGEGSYMMNQPAGATASRMTNGSVSASQSRMSNGSVKRSGRGQTLTVQYQGGVQKVTGLPPDTPVERVSTQHCQTGRRETGCFCRARKNSDGSLSSSKGILAGRSASKTELLQSCGSIRQRSFYLAALLAAADSHTPRPASDAQQRAQSHVSS